MPENNGTLTDEMLVEIEADLHNRPALVLEQDVRKLIAAAMVAYAAERIAEDREHQPAYQWAVRERGWLKRATERMRFLAPSHDHGRTFDSDDFELTNCARCVGDRALNDLAPFTSDHITDAMAERDAAIAKLADAEAEVAVADGVSRKRLERVRALESWRAKAINLYPALDDLVDATAAADHGVSEGERE